VREVRTLKDCALRLSDYEWQFPALVTTGFDWFKKCIEIDTAFDYSKLGLIVLMPLKNSEKSETPQGTFYIYDGVHKTIVLAKKLLRNEIKFEAVELLLLSPRREQKGALFRSCIDEFRNVVKSQAESLRRRPAWSKCALLICSGKFD